MLTNNKILLDASVPGLAAIPAAAAIDDNILVL